MDGSTKEQAGHRGQERVLGFGQEMGRVSNAEIVWAKSARGVWGLANVLATGKVYFTHDVPQANCLPQGLEPPAKPRAKPAPKAAKSRAKPSTRSAAKHAAQMAAKPAALLAAGEPSPVAPAEHVHLFRAKHSRRKKGHTAPFSQ